MRPAKRTSDSPALAHELNQINSISLKDKFVIRVLLYETFQV